jgi:hypothetical protein
MIQAFSTVTYLHPSLIFADKSVGYPRGAPYELLSKYRLTALAAYIILRWKRLGLSNNLAYYDKELNTALKGFIA